jgi:hypothetical protein
MNFYSVDGSSYDNQVYQSCNNMMIESFENIQYNNSTNSDDKYQCSDNYRLSGDNMLTINNTTVDICKKSCASDVNCVGFDYDNNSKQCRIYKNVSSLNNQDPNSFFCIRKDIGSCATGDNGSSNLPITVNLTTGTEPTRNTSNNTDNQLQHDSYIDLLNKYNEKLDELKNISINAEEIGNRFNELSDELKTIDGKIIDNKEFNDRLFENNNLVNLIKSENEILKKEISHYSDMEKELRDKLDEKCDKDKIYIDLGCFLANMDNLKNHADNMMIDLGVLVANIKTCAYLAKDSATVTTPKPVETVNVVDQIKIPKPEEVVLQKPNIPLPGMGLKPGNQDKREKFENVGPEYTGFNWFSTDLLIAIFIVFIFWIIIFQRKKN